MPIDWHAQAGQDRIAHWLFPGGGFYVEIGAGEPFDLSSTAALERLGWRGISIEKESGRADRFRQVRTNPIVCGDGTVFDWSAVELPPSPEFLSLDIDEFSLAALINFPLARVRPKFVAYEHNRYWTGDLYRDPARRLMADHGYVLLCSDVRLLDRQLGDYQFEDWFVLPELLPRAEPLRADDIDWKQICRQAGIDLPLLLL